tara:strand:- start:775 stop:1767 length:993 start_codon:yes stop_codon:yes gene_type:complete
MAFQDSAGGIVLDAVLTDIGRKRKAQGNFKVTHYGLGDDEIDYTFGTASSGTWEITASTPILEAFAGQQANIKYGLLNLPRNDIYYMPQLNVNTLITGSVSKHSTGQCYYLSINYETSKKLKSDVGDAYYLQNDSVSTNVLLIESGINLPSTSNNSIKRDKTAQDRYIRTAGLYDQHYFVYCDSRLIDNIYTNAPDAYYKNDALNKMYTNMTPLVRIVKNSLDKASIYHESYACTGMINEIYDHGNGGDDQLSSLNGPRATALAINLKLNDKIINASGSTADDRFRVFGKLNQDIFGTGNMYDYIETNIMIAGASSKKQLVVPLRIVRSI